MKSLTCQEMMGLLPYFILTGGSFFLLTVSLFFRKKEPTFLLKTLTFVTALSSLYFLWNSSNHLFFQGWLVHDFISRSFGCVLLVLLVCVIPIFWFQKNVLQEGAIGLFSLLLLSAMGGLTMVASDHLLLFFVGLEILSLPLYVMTSLGGNIRASTEAGFKYFILGAVTSAFFIYGAALLWASFGTMSVSQIAHAIGTSQFNSPELAAFGAALVVAAVAFKIGLVPFQMWIPDVYQGAPCAVVAWMSGATKIATFAFALRLLGNELHTLFPFASSVLSTLAMASMLWGSFAALYQTNVKRILAYSSIAHAGYAAIALVVHLETKEFSTEIAQALLFYLFTYGLASFAAFAILSIEEEKGAHVSDLKGLAIRKPFYALAFAISLLSLAGLPPLGGFIAKFNLFMLAARQNAYHLILVGVGTSLISLAYYLRLIVVAYMEEPISNAPIRPILGIRVTLCTVALVTLLLGIFPETIFHWFLP